MHAASAHSAERGQRATRPFLTAEWRWLVMLNFAVDPALLAPFVPRGTELDAFAGVTYASIVAFRFLNTRVLGVAVPGHRDFDELNLRFYVRRAVAGEVRRGVVFIKEVVPRAAIAAIARWFYNENYVAMPMGHEVKPHGTGGIEARYEWKHATAWNHVGARAFDEPEPLRLGSIEEFVTEHYWGYARQRDGGTVEYEVQHPRWRVWQGSEWEWECDVGALYGASFVPPLKAKPLSVFIADGSPVTVYRGQRIG